MTAELVRKLSPKTVLEKKVEAPSKATPLYRVYGIARGVRSGESQFGIWTALVGSFEAIRIDDGAVFAGIQCFLPEPMNGMIADKLRHDSETKEVQFAVEVGIKPSDVPVGYEYTSKPIVDVEQADALAGLREKVALPAPKGK